MGVLLLSLLATGFAEDQLSYARVRQAKAHFDLSLQAELAQQGFAKPPKGLLFRIFKREKRFEVWAEKAGKLELFKVHEVCASSGLLGPKMRRGDLQVPEGIYALSTFNPNSNYHLSLKVDYPNASDRARANRHYGRTLSNDELGGDIYIHGDCVTIGCVPLTDAIAEEVYWLAVLARAAGQVTIPIHIFPARFDDLPLLLARANSEETRELWTDLAAVSRRFDAEHRVPKVTIQGARYILH